MLGLTVIASYGNYRTYRIDDVNFNLTPMSKFTSKEGPVNYQYIIFNFPLPLLKPISYIDYYKTRYKLDIRSANQPLLLTRDRRNPDKLMYLIPELVDQIMYIHSSIR